MNDVIRSMQARKMIVTHPSICSSSSLLYSTSISSSLNSNIVISTESNLLSSSVSSFNSVIKIKTKIYEN